MAWSSQDWFEWTWSRAGGPVVNLVNQGGVGRLLVVHGGSGLWQ